jgi:hypothetical protein
VVSASLAFPKEAANVTPVARAYLGCERDRCCNSALIVLIARAAYRNGECPYEFRAVDTWTSSDNG